MGIITQNVTMESCFPSGRGAIRWVSGEECSMSPLTTAQCLFYFHSLPTMTLIQTLDIASRQLYFTIFKLFSNYLLTRYIYLVSTEFAKSTGCPILLGPLSFCHFLGFWSTYRGTFHSHRIAHEISIPKLTLLSILHEILTKLQHKT